MDQSTASRTLPDLGLTRNASMDEIRIAYIRRLRESAAGREGEEREFNIVDERARLAKEQADRVAMSNAIQRRELAPISLLESSLARMSRKIVAVLEAIPAHVKTRSPAIKAKEVEIIAQEIVKARNIAAAVRLEDDGTDDDTAERDNERAAAA